MKLDLGEFQVSTDSMQYIVSKKKTIKESRLTKKENIGKETLETVGYYSTLKGSLKGIGNQIMLDNDNLQDILNKLAELNKSIDAMTKLLEVHEVVEEDVQE